MGMIYHKGESLRLTVGAYQAPQLKLPFGAAKITIAKDQFTFDPQNPPEMMTLGGGSSQCASLTEVVQALPSRNKGTHIFHLGGKYDSFLSIPVIAAKK